MVLRFLMRYLANHEEVINKLADSKPIRRAARFVVYVMTRSSVHGLPTNQQELSKQWTGLLTRLVTNMKKEISMAKEELKNKQSK